MWPLQFRIRLSTGQITSYALKAIYANYLGNLGEYQTAKRDRIARYSRATLS